jgi:FtsP/CotA-like multicopper oxidase with cupredoxin domain
VPGPTLRCVEGERLRIHFSNAGTHPHTIHLHSIHPARMDGISGAGLVAPGESFTYEVDAKPFGCHLYHCHSMPLKRHIHKGLYGALIIDPDPDRHPEHRPAALGRRHGTPEHASWQEFIMVMNGFDTNFDGDNEVYAINTAAFYYQNHPIQVGVGDPVRIYLLNLTEFDPINSLHLHASMFRYYRTGTRPDHYDLTDTVMLCQGERGIIEMELENPGLHMCHAHQSEFAELGWMSFLEAVPKLAAGEGVPLHRYG